MSCCGAPPTGNVPLPNNRQSGGSGFLVNNPRRNGGGGGGIGRTSFFSRRVHRASAAMQNPSSITFREFATALFALFVLYRTYTVLAGDVRRLLLVEPVDSICVGISAFDCARRYISALLYVLFQRWAAEILPWGFVAVVTVFFGEEALAMVRGRR